MSKKVQLISEQGEPTSSQDVLSAHTHPAALHAACSVWVFFQGQTLLQQRSGKKIVGATQWGNAICGNLAPNELPEDCADRRLRQELWVDTDEMLISPPKKAYSFMYKCWSNHLYGENELDSVFVAKASSRFIPHPNPDEVEDTCWVYWDDLLGAVDMAAPNYITSEQTLRFDSSDLAPFTPSVSISISSSDIDTFDCILTPWTVLMLKDVRLREYVKNNRLI